jgi:sarcosine oxidase gamma subunit
VQEESESKRPLRRAMVRLSGDQLLTARQTLTRDDGTFTFDGLPSGQYNLSAQRSSYMTAEFGARRPGGTGSAIALGNGQRLANIVLRLSPYGSITGMVFDQDGEPAPNISVEALRYSMRTGRRTLSSVYGQPSTTDDRGVYRVGGLAPGEYFIAAGPSPDRGPMDVQRLTTADLDRVMQILASPASSAAPVVFAEPHQGFAPVYFPGATDLARAQSIVLTIGEDRGGVDLRLQLVRMATIDGTLTAPDGRAVTDVRIFATPITEASSLDLFSPSTVAPAAVDAQGRFRFPAVAPGRYTVSASMAAAPGGQSGPLWATADLAVSGGNQTIALTLQPGMAVSGKVVFSGGTLQAPANMTGGRVIMMNAERLPSGFFTDPLGVAPVNVNPDGTFTLTGAAPGNYRLSVTLPGSASGWALRSAFVNGADSLDTPFIVTPGRSIDDAVVIFTDRPTELSGTLQTPAGTPTADYFIVVFATDKAFWLPSSRRNVSARPASSGKYSVRNLPPGEYFIVAVTDVEQGDWWDPTFLERLAPVATRFTLSEGEKKTLDLKIGG